MFVGLFPISTIVAFVLLVGYKKIEICVVVSGCGGGDGHTARIL